MTELLPTELAPVLEAVGGDCVAAVEIAREDFIQARSLTDEAVATLGQAFGGIAEESQRQSALVQNVMATLAAGLRPGEGDDPESSAPALAGPVLTASQLLDEFTLTLLTVAKFGLDCASRVDEVVVELARLDVHLGQAGKLDDTTRSMLERARQSAEAARTAAGAAASHDIGPLSGTRRQLDATLDHFLAFETFLDEQMREAAASNERVAAQASDALRCLQFGDLVHQVADHGEETLAHLATQLARLAPLLAPGSPAASALLTAAANEFRATMPRRLVDQQDLGGGDIEFF